jgi:hypothetical protein
VLDGRLGDDHRVTAIVETVTVEETPRR